jgi:hypothetical protein
VLNTSGASLGTLLTKTNPQCFRYTAYSVDLLPFKGQVIRPSFKSYEDAQNATSFLLDDVVANIVAPPQTSPIISSFTPTSGVAERPQSRSPKHELLRNYEPDHRGSQAGITLTDGTALAASVVATRLEALPSRSPMLRVRAPPSSNFSVIYGVPVITGVNPT